jgi:hypothetical protein
MADDTQVSVQIAADASGVQAGVATASDAMTNLGGKVADVSAQVKTDTAAMGEAVANVAPVVQTHIAAIGGAGEQARSGIGGLLGAAAAALAPFNEFAAAIALTGQETAEAYKQLMDFAEQIGGAGEKVQHTAQSFGLTTGEVQRLQTVLTAAGVGPATLGAAMTALNASVAQAASGQKAASDAFKAIGVDLTQARTPAELMQATLQGFAGMAEGPAKAAASLAIFRGDADMATAAIGLTKDKLADYNTEAVTYGTVNEDAVAHAAALGDSMNANKNAMAGVQNVLAEALSPALIQIVDAIDGVIAGFTRSYTQGGVARTVMDLLATTLSVVGTVMQEVGEVFADVWQAISGDTNFGAQAIDFVRDSVLLFGAAVVVLGTVVRNVFASIGGALDQGEVAWTTFGRVIVDVLTLDWGRIEGDIAAGAARIGAIAHTASQKMLAEWSEANAQINHLGQGSPKTEASPGETKTKPPAPVGGGGGGGNGGGGGGGGGGRGGGSTAADGQVAKWSEQLRQEGELQQNWYADQNKLAVDFWNGVTKSGQGSANDQKQANENLTQAKKAQDAEVVASAVAAAKKQAEEAGSDVDKVKGIYATLETTLRADYVEGGAEWKKVEDDKADATEKAMTKARQAQTKVIEDHAKAEQSDAQTQGSVATLKVQGQQQAVHSQAQRGQVDPQQELTQTQALDQQIYQTQVQTEDRVYQAKLASLYKQRDLQNQTPQQIAEINGQIEAAQAAHYGKLDVMSAQNDNKIAQGQQAAAQQSQQHWEAIVSPVTSGFASMTEGMLEHTETFGQGMTKMLTQLLNTFIQWEFTQLAHHIAGEAAKTGATVAGEAERTTAQQAGASQSLLINLETTLQTVTNNAVSAASAAFQYFANMGPLAIPLGAAAAAATFTAVEAFGALASASGGYDIGNENPLTQLHAQEMVLPASIATPLRGMIAANSNGAGGGSGGSSGGGDTYNMAINALDSRSLKRTMNNPGNVRAAAGAFAKHG